MDRVPDDERADFPRLGARARCIEACDGIDWTTQDMVIDILRDEEGHLRQFERYLREFE